MLLEIPRGRWCAKIGIDPDVLAYLGDFEDNPTDVVCPFYGYCSESSNMNFDDAPEEPTFIGHTMEDGVIQEWERCPSCVKAFPYGGTVEIKTKERP